MLRLKPWRLAALAVVAALGSAVNAQPSPDSGSASERLRQAALMLLRESSDIHEIGRSSGESERADELDRMASRLF